MARQSPSVASRDQLVYPFLLAAGCVDGECSHEGLLVARMAVSKRKGSKDFNYGRSLFGCFWAFWLVKRSATVVVKHGPITEESLFSRVFIAFTVREVGKTTYLCYVRAWCVVQKERRGTNILENSGVTTYTEGASSSKYCFCTYSKIHDMDETIIREKGHSTCCFTRIVRTLTVNYSVRATAGKHQRRGHLCLPIMSTDCETVIRVFLVLYESYRRRTNPIMFRV
jgi:hypothetical protein